MCRLSGSVGRDRRLVVLPVMLFALLGACASGGGGRHAEPGMASDAAEESEAPTHVVVNNNSWDQVTVYIAQGSATWRLGDVAPMTQRTLPLRNVGTSLVGRTAQFIGRRLAGAAMRSESFDVSRGMGIPTWTIENQSAFSYVLFR
jgi:hypothetical protein